MIEVVKVLSTEKRDALRNQYFMNLQFPMDGYWQNVVVYNSDCYKIMYNNKFVGHLSIKEDKTLVQFFIIDEYYTYASDIFKYLISSDIVESGAVSTIESAFLSLCLDYHKSISVNSYLFVDNKNIKYYINDFEELSFRLAKEKDLYIIEKECGKVYEGYYEDLIKNNQLFVLYDGKVFLGIGEFRVNKIHSQYADIGMIVVEKYRNRGIGTYIITKLKEHCNMNNVIAIASCNSKNIASKKTLEKAGLISMNRIIDVEFR